MAAVFPEYFAAVHACARQGKQLLEMERQILGMDHCELGGMYLRHHNLPDTAVQAALFHHQPELAPRHARYVAAVHIADLLVRHAEIGDSGNYEPVPEKLWTDAPAWGILFPGTSEEERPIAAANLRRSLERLPAILEGMV
jgi:HD-like signal output (HDOD) protein